MLDKVFNYPFFGTYHSYASLLESNYLNNNKLLALWDGDLLPTENYMTKFDNYICVGVGVRGQLQDEEIRQVSRS